MTLNDTKKLAASIFRLLKVTEISFPIGRTNKGNFEIKLTAQNDDFDILLDAVPLPTLSKINDENNITLKSLIEKYWFYSQLETSASSALEQREVFASVLPEKKKGGRPKGSKNRLKPVEDKVNG